MRAACRAAGVTQSTPYHRRKAHPDFRAQWDAIQRVDGRRALRRHGARNRELRGYQKYGG